MVIINGLSRCFSGSIIICSIIIFLKNNHRIIDNISNGSFALSARCARARLKTDGERRKDRWAWIMSAKKRFLRRHGGGRERGGRKEKAKRKAKWRSAPFAPHAAFYFTLALPLHTHLHRAARTHTRATTTPHCARRAHHALPLLRTHHARTTCALFAHHHTPHAPARAFWRAHARTRKNYQRHQSSSS